MNKNEIRKVVLAYSGGLDTSIIIPWLKENYDLEVIACCVNVGQEDDMEEVRKKAVESGATKVYVEDKREEFVRDYAFRGLKAGAVYEHKYLLGTAFARPLIAKTLVDVAHKEDAKYICHGATGKGNDQVRFETGIASFDPELKIIAPWRMWDISSREDAIDYANKHGISVPVTKEKIYSRDQNLWHISHEGGDIEDLTTEHQEDILYLMTTSPEKAKNDPTYLLADVELVASYGLPENIVPHKLEKLIHKVLQSAQLNIFINDRIGNPVKPQEWFLVPLNIIDEIIEKIKDGTIQNFIYIPTLGKLENV